MGKLDLDLENEEKLKSVLHDDSLCINEILEDDMIDNTKTKLIEKSPSNMNNIFKQADRKGDNYHSDSNGNNSNSNYNYSKSDKDNSPLFFNKSPTLDSYLLPNRDKSNSKNEEEEDETFPAQNMNFNLTKALEKFQNNNQDEEYNYVVDNDDQMEVEEEIDPEYINDTKGKNPFY